MVNYSTKTNGTVIGNWWTGANNLAITANGDYFSDKNDGTFYRTAIDVNGGTTAGGYHAQLANYAMAGSYAGKFDYSEITATLGTDTEAGIFVDLIGNEVRYAYGSDSALRVTKGSLGGGAQCAGRFTDGLGQQVDICDGTRALLITGALVQNPGTVTLIDANGFMRPISSNDAGAPNNSIYYSTTQNKLVYKDSGGTVHDLY
jgi:hypothetical protein